MFDEAQSGADLTDLYKRGAIDKLEFAEKLLRADRVDVGEVLRLLEDAAHDLCQAERNHARAAGCVKHALSVLAERRAFPRITVSLPTPQRLMDLT